MKKYETVIVLTCANGEEATQTLLTKFKDLIANNGTVDSVEEWGKRRLAYPINDELDGHYTVIKHTCEVDFPAEMDRVFKITDGVLRTMIVAKGE